MTEAEAATLRGKWNLQVDPPVCTHPTLELEQSDRGYLTGKHHCVDCGEFILKKV